MVKPQGSMFDRFGRKIPPRPKVAAPGSCKDKNYKEIKHKIMNIVNAHSGGLKMVELIPEINHSFDYQERITSDIVEQAISEMPNYHVLEYEWKMSEDLSRGKQFVYYKEQ
ncbi:MAG: hypothetical protein GF364_09595 [Candidatus Lokiarchaeota archaeon]|nr:hypothetical protein [Candidatus Lokiarchaeota archaeon]